MSSCFQPYAESTADVHWPKIGDPLRMSTATSKTLPPADANQLRLRERGQLVMKSAQHPGLGREGVVVLDEIELDPFFFPCPLVPDLREEAALVRMADGTDLENSVEPGRANLRHGRNPPRAA